MTDEAFFIDKNIKWRLVVYGLSLFLIIKIKKYTPTKHWLINGFKKKTDHDMGTLMLMNTIVDVGYVKMNNK